MRSARGSVLLLVLATACSTAAGTETSTSTSVASATTAPAAPTTSVPPPTTSPASKNATVEIVDEAFQVGGEVTNPGGTAEGMLLNSRMVQAVIDIEEHDAPFVYPDTESWDPDRNTDEFIGALPEYAAAGLDAVTINLQGGNPLAAPVDNRPEWRISAYGPDGSLDQKWMTRLDRTLTAADENGIVVILGLFYFGQDHQLADESAVVAAVDNVVDWLVDNDHENVLVEICNECNVHYDHPILQPDRVTELMDRVRQRSGGALPVSASLTGGNVPSDRWIEASDFVLLHGNRQDAASISRMVTETRARPSFQSSPLPIVFNEDSTNLANMAAAIEAGAGWGYHDKGDNDYVNGFQAPPVNWTINTPDKQAFFEAVASVSG